MQVEARLQALGLTLPDEPLPPPGVVLPFSRVLIRGSRAFLSGTAPHNLDGTVADPRGKVGGTLTLEQGYAAARLVAVTHIGALKRRIGDLDRVVAWLKVLGMVNSDPLFTDQPSVINGYSDLILEVFGQEIGQHSRSACGVAALPWGIPVEVEAEVEIAV
jgi:enamine deaminase RidA (YjgF/YER057c/UK114 family)